jgi:MFS family permease
MVAIRFPEDNAAVFGACESAIGMGMMLGPILGQVLYYFGFEGCFYGTGVLILICAFITHCSIPEALNKNDEKPATEQGSNNFSLNADGNPSSSESEQEKNKISYLSIFTNLRAFVVISSCVFASIFLMFNEPIISDQLIHTGLSDQLVGKKLELKEYRLRIWSRLYCVCDCSPLNSVVVEPFQKGDT